MLKILLLVPLIILGACDNNEGSQFAGNAPQMAEASMYMGGGAASVQRSRAMPAPSMDGHYAQITQAAPPSSMVLDRTKFKGRRIAETHSMQIQTPYDGLQARYQRDYAKCVELGCEISSSNVQMEQGGQINARISPENLGPFVDYLAEGPGKILNHSVSADDQTMAYSDTKAEMDNLVALRDRLHALLKSRDTAKVQDVLGIERELTRVQTEIDTRTQRLRLLEQITEMATVNLNYSVEYRPVEAEKYTLANTWDMAVQNFYRAIDNMVRFVGTALPWLPVIFVGFWLAVRICRLAFARVKLPWPRRKGQD